jgi:hypothetical protein
MNAAGDGSDDLVGNIKCIVEDADAEAVVEPAIEVRLDLLRSPRGLGQIFDIALDRSVACSWHLSFDSLSHS